MNPEKTLLNALLEGRSDTFKAKVLEIVYRHNLDCNDPNFQILIATGQLEVLLEQAPEQFETQFSRLLEIARRLMDTEMKSLQQVLHGEQESVRQHLQGVKQLTDEHQQRFEQSLQAIQDAAQEARSRFNQDIAERQRSLDAQEAQQNAEHQRKRETSIQEYKAALAKEAKEVIQLAALELRGSWAMRVAIPSAIAFLSIASIGFIGGWSAKSAQVYQRYSPAELEFLGQLWQENSDLLAECQSRNKTVCEVELQPSEAR